MGSTARCKTAFIDLERTRLPTDLFPSLAAAQELDAEWCCM
jgi:hypothetical protein